MAPSIPVSTLAKGLDMGLDKVLGQVQSRLLH